MFCTVAYTRSVTLVPRPDLSDEARRSSVADQASPCIAPDCHRTRRAFETDRERDRLLQADGWRVVRITWRQLDAETGVAADLTRLLER
jgi:hypothetical protein